MKTVTLTRRELEMAADAMRSHYNQIAQDFPNAGLTSNAHKAKLEALALRNKFEAAQ